MRFDNAVYLRFDFTLGTAALADVTVEIGGRLYGADIFTDNGDGTYSVYTSAIYSTEFDKAFTATLKTSGNVAHTATYSVNSYVKAMHENENIGELAKALYFYGANSEAYVDLEG